MAPIAIQELQKELNRFANMSNTAIAEIEMRIHDNDELESSRDLNKILPTCSVSL